MAFVPPLRLHRFAHAGLQRLSHESGGAATLASICVPLMALLFAFVMGRALDHNEHMYLTAGHLGRDASMYADFAFLQMPYLPALYSYWFAVTDASHLLMWGRLLTFLCAMGSALLVFHHARSISKSGLVALGALFVMFMNKNVQAVFDESSNYALSMFMSILAFHCMILGIGRAGTCMRGGWFFTAGIAMAGAIGTKLTYAPLVIPFCCVALLYPAALAPGRRAARTLLPFIVGLVLGLFPAFLYFAESPHSFVYSNVGYHLENARWSSEVGRGGTRMDFLIRRQVGSESLAIVIGLGLLAHRVRASNAATLRSREGPTPQLVLTTLLACAGLITAWLPFPSQYPYYGVPIPFGVLALVVVFSKVRSDSGARRTFGALVVIACLSSAHRYVRELGTPSDWPGLKVHAAAQHIRSALREAQASGPQEGTACLAVAERD